MKSIDQISVIIPTYNRAAITKEAIQSVLDQTYSNYEIIIVDDGSTDNTRETITNLSNKIRYVYQNHQGRSKARNLALRAVQGKYIAFLDSDDLFQPTKLDTQINCLENSPDFGMSYTSALCVNTEKAKMSLAYKATTSGWLYRQIAFRKPITITLSTVMVRTDVMHEIGFFDERMERFEDTDMWRRISRRYKILSIPEPLTILKVHTENRLCNQNPYEIAQALDYYINKTLLEDCNSIYSQYGAADLYRYYGEALLTQPKWQNTARYLLRQSNKYQPHNLTTQLALTLSHLDTRTLNFVTKLICALRGINI